jgi:hypothetical protein
MKCSSDAWQVCKQTGDTKMFEINKILMFCILLKTDFILRVPAEVLSAFNPLTPNDL